MVYNIEKFKEELTELRRKKERGSIYDYDLGRLVMAECIEKLIIPDVVHLLTEYEKFASGENYINSKPLIDKQIKEFIEVNCG